MNEPKRYRLTDDQCRKWHSDVVEFGYTNVTFEECRRIADEVADGTHSPTDVLAILLIRDLCRADEFRRIANKTPLRTEA